jgi:hypothetical protein
MMPAHDAPVSVCAMARVGSVCWRRKRETEVTAFLYHLRGHEHKTRSCCSPVSCRVNWRQQKRESCRGCVARSVPQSVGRSSPSVPSASSATESHAWMSLSLSLDRHGAAGAGHRRRARGAHPGFAHGRAKSHAPSAIARFGLELVSAVGGALRALALLRLIGHPTQPPLTCWDLCSRFVRPSIRPSSVSMSGSIRGTRKYTSPAARSYSCGSLTRPCRNWILLARATIHLAVQKCCPTCCLRRNTKRIDDIFTCCSGMQNACWRQNPNRSESTSNNLFEPACLRSLLFWELITPAIKETTQAEY